MRLRLQEDPREWRKFAAVGTLFMLVLGGLAWTRGWWTAGDLALAMAGLIVALAIGLARPRWIRPVYRAVMTASFHVGQAVGWVFLVCLFLLVVTPLGLGLRLAGKDLLQLRKPRGVQSYWQPAGPDTPLDRMF